jgi:hypothetical protein
MLGTLKLVLGVLGLATKKDIRELRQMLQELRDAQAALLVRLGEVEVLVDDKLAELKANAVTADDVAAAQANAAKLEEIAAKLV